MRPNGFMGSVRTITSFIVSDLLFSSFMIKTAEHSPRATNFGYTSEENRTVMQMYILIPIKPLGLIVYGQCFLGDNVFAIDCIP